MYNAYNFWHYVNVIATDWYCYWRMKVTDKSQSIDWSYFKHLWLIRLLVHWFQDNKRSANIDSAFLAITGQRKQKAAYTNFYPNHKIKHHSKGRLAKKKYIKNDNLLHPNISIYILSTVLFTFPIVLIRRIWLTIKSIWNWLSFPLF